MSWTFTPGEVGDINATVAYADPDAPSVAELGDRARRRGGARGGVVVVAARRTRNPPVSPRVR